MNPLIYWKLAIFKCLSGVLRSGILAFLAGTATVTWSEMAPFARLVVILTTGLAMLTFLDGFMDQTISRLQAGKPPVGTNGGTDFYKKVAAVPGPTLPLPLAQSTTTISAEVKTTTEQNK